MVGTGLFVFFVACIVMRYSRVIKEKFILLCTV